jgi:hypothetical protein
MVCSASSKPHRVVIPACYVHARIYLKTSSKDAMGLVGNMEFQKSPNLLEDYFAWKVSSSADQLCHWEKHCFLILAKHSELVYALREVGRHTVGKGAIGINYLNDTALVAIGPINLSIQKDQQHSNFACIVS